MESLTTNPGNHLIKKGSEKKEMSEQVEKTNDVVFPKISSTSGNSGEAVKEITIDKEPKSKSAEQADHSEMSGSTNIKPDKKAGSANTGSVRETHDVDSTDDSIEESEYFKVKIDCGNNKYKWLGDGHGLLYPTVGKFALYFTKESITAPEVQRILRKGKYQLVRTTDRPNFDWQIYAPREKD